MTASTPALPPEFTHFEFPGGVHLAVNSNRKMKTVHVSTAFIGNLDESVTQRALLPMVLRRGTRRYPDMQAITRRLEGLYGTSLAAYVQKIGEWHLIRFRLDVVNDRFLPGESGVLREALQVFHEVMYDPLQVGDGFQPAFFAQEKENLKRAIESLIDSKAAYADQRLIEEMCPREPFRLHEQGRVADLPAISPGSLHAAYRTWVGREPLHLYVAGDVAVEAARDLVASVFVDGAPPRQGGHVLSGLPPRVPASSPPRSVKETMAVNQARLLLGFRHGITYADPAYESLLVMNGVLGAFSHSKLFQNVREKASLCYSIHSSLERTKGLLFIAAGIAAGNAERTLEIVLKELKGLQDGDVGKDELAATIATILNHNEMLEDNLPALGDVDLTWRLHGRRLDLPAFRQRLRAVRREDVVAAARRLEHDTTYLLTP
jgi:predicted Zn-dependent peptidase